MKNTRMLIAAVLALIALSSLGATVQATEGKYSSEAGEDYSSAALALTGNWYTGTLDSADPSDYYFFTSLSDERLNLTFSYLFTPVSPSGFFISLYSPFHKATNERLLLASFNGPGSSGTGNIDFSLGRNGTYEASEFDNATFYLVFSADISGPGNVTYMFNFIAKPQAEPDGDAPDLAHAEPLNATTHVDGSLGYWDGEDAYNMSLAPGHRLNVTLSNTGPLTRGSVEIDILINRTVLVSNRTVAPNQRLELTNTTMGYYTLLVRAQSGAQGYVPADYSLELQISNYTAPVTPQDDDVDDDVDDDADDDVADDDDDAFVGSPTFYAIIVCAAILLILVVIIIVVLVRRSKKPRKKLPPPPVPGVNAPPDTKKKKPKFCPECGAKVVPGDKFCGECGKEF